MPPTADSNGQADTATPAPPREDVLAQAALLQQLMAELLPMIEEYQRANAYPDTTQVVEYHEPEELRKRLGLQNSLSGDAPAQPPELLAAIRQLLQYSVRTAHPRFFDKLFAGTDAVGQVAEFLTAVLNTNVHTYAVSPVFSLIELEVNRTMARMFGMDPDDVEGCMTPGASFANLMGMVAARHLAFPHMRLEGMRPEDRPVMFASSHAHYSVRRAAMVLGLGMNAVVPVKADLHGRMDIAELEKAIEAALQQGQQPFMVSATAGTTVMGGFDYFRPLRTICDKYKLWLHVDAAWGTAAAFSSCANEWIAGIDKADSVAWDAHKGMAMPIFSSGTLVQGHRGLLREANSSNAEYLFHEPENSYDLGDGSLQCGRRADSIKFYLCWLAQGRLGYQTRIDHVLSLSAYLTKKLVADNRFLLLVEPTYVNVCFWYLPPSLRGLTVNEARGRTELTTVTKTIYRRMQSAGSMLLNFNPLTCDGQNLPHFFRFVSVQLKATFEDMDFVIAEIDRLGRDIVV